MATGSEVGSSGGSAELAQSRLNGERCSHSQEEEERGSEASSATLVEGPGWPQIDREEEPPDEADKPERTRWGRGRVVAFLWPGHGRTLAPPRGQIESP